MTKKDYQRFIHMFQHELLVAADGDNERAVVWRIISKTADLFQADSARFDRDRFLKACSKDVPTWVPCR